MPYKSAKQKAWMHINKPKLADKWDKKYGTKVKAEKEIRKKAYKMLRGK